MLYFVEYWVHAKDPAFDFVSTRIFKDPVEVEKFKDFLGEDFVRIVEDNPNDRPF